MEFPEVDITADDSIDSAAQKVEEAFEAHNSDLMGFEHLNSHFPTSSWCRFYQTRLEGGEHLIIVTMAPWDEQSVLTVLNILLNIRLDPDPPGSSPRFRFLGPYPPPAVLQSLFGDAPVSAFECYAALVANFGNDLLSQDAMQLAAVAVHLLRERLGVSSGFFDLEGDLRIGSVVVEQFREDAFPAETVPLNSMILLGFLYGEILRSRLPYPARWVRLKDGTPWPLLVLGKEPEGGTADSTSLPEGAAVTPGGVPQVVFNPISWVLNLRQTRVPALLRQATVELEGKCAETLSR